VTKTIPDTDTNTCVCVCVHVCVRAHLIEGKLHCTVRYISRDQPCEAFVKAAYAPCFSHTRTHTHTHTHTHTRIISVSGFVCVTNAREVAVCYVCVCVCVCVCIHSYIHTYIYTHIYIHTYINTKYIHTYAEQQFSSNSLRLVYKSLGSAWTHEPWPLQEHALWTHTMTNFFFLYKEVIFV
jgi:hypothetical protein